MYIHHFYYTTYDCVIEYIDFLPYCRSNLTLHNFYFMTKYFYATWKKARRDIAKYLTSTRKCTATHIYIHIILLRTNVLLNASISLHITYCKLNLILHDNIFIFYNKKYRICIFSCWEDVTIVCIFVRHPWESRFLFRIRWEDCMIDLRFFF